MPTQQAFTSRPRRPATPSRVLGAACLLALGLAACAQKAPAPAPTLPSVGTSGCGGAGSSGVIPGEYLVRFGGVRASSLSTLSVKGGALHLVRPLGTGGALYQADARLSSSEVLGALRARPDVLWAEPNRRVRLFKTPSDTYFAKQDDFQAINLPAAWDTTTGVSSVTVAVVDTGLLFEPGNPAKSHPDLDGGRILPGYDFISDANCANDGDGRDPDPYDSGDLEDGTQSSYHGSHVAGTIGAATNNGKGIAGVNWAAKLLPVRVLGEGGGSLSDVIDGMLWSAGQPVSGVPNNPNKAAVINLSLGGDGACPASLQSAINTAVNAGAVVVVAAGNAGQDAAGTFPANCKGVVTVGATTSSGKLAYYSNYGPNVTLLAPGGDGAANGIGILSLGYDDDPKSSTYGFGYVFDSGTSMATPHVAGVVSLLKGLRPSLTPAQLISILKSTAAPRSSDQCQSGGKAVECGAGLLDAAAAVKAATAPSVP